MAQMSVKIVCKALRSGGGQSRAHFERKKAIVDLENAQKLDRVAEARARLHSDLHRIDAVGGNIERDTFVEVEFLARHAFEVEGRLQQKKAARLLTIADCVDSPSLCYRHETDKCDRREFGRRWAPRDATSANFELCRGHRRRSRRSKRSKLTDRFCRYLL